MKDCLTTPLVLDRGFQLNFKITFRNATQVSSIRNPSKSSLIPELAQRMNAAQTKWKRNVFLLNLMNAALNQIITLGTRKNRASQAHVSNNRPTAQICGCIFSFAVICVAVV